LAEKKSMPAGNASGWRHAAVFGVFALLCLGGAARAEDAESWKEIETKYIFGFTVGSGIGLEGEKEFTIDTRPVRQARRPLQCDGDEMSSSSRRRRSSRSNSVLDRP
jgi:hypothetical protein